MAAARDRKNLRILPENSAGESAAAVTYLSMRIHPKSYCIPPPKNICNFYLMVQGRAQLEHSSHVVKVNVEVTCYNTSSPDVY